MILCVSLTRVFKDTSIPVTHLRPVLSAGCFCLTTHSAFFLVFIKMTHERNWGWKSLMEDLDDNKMSRRGQCSNWNLEMERDWFRYITPLFFLLFSHMKCTESIFFTPLCNIYIDRNKALVMRYTVCWQYILFLLSLTNVSCRCIINLTVINSERQIHIFPFWISTKCLIW